jgi:hypothetical protein
MSRASKITLLLAIGTTVTTITYVHYAQTRERKARRKSIEYESN